MPQEIALYGEFSIRETMMYFGWIFGMQTSEIKERLQFLLNFLDLPSESRLVKNLRFVPRHSNCVKLNLLCRKIKKFHENYSTIPQYFLVVVKL